MFSMHENNHPVELGKSTYGNQDAPFYPKMRRGGLGYKTTGRDYPRHSSAIMVIPGLGLHGECSIEDSEEESVQLITKAANFGQASKNSLISAPNPEDCFDAPDVEMMKFDKKFSKTVLR